MKPEMKPYVAEIKAYVPGTSTAADGRKLVKLSANESPLGASPAAMAALAETPTPEYYPDPGANALRAQLAALHGLAMERVICGTGSDELLNLAAQAFAGPGDEVLQTDFTFMMYKIAAQRVGATIVTAPAINYGTDVDVLLDHVTERTKVVFLANPNNPTGTYLPREEVARLHAALPKNVLFVLDQAYAEYLPEGVDDGGMDLARETDNVLVTRTFSKIYGLAGQRIGYATGAQDLIEALYRIRGPFSVNTLGERAATAAAKDQAFVTSVRDHTIAERARFVAAMDALGNHGISTIPSEANFVMVLFDGALTAEAARDAIADAGYAVRYFPQAGLDHTLRITIGTAGQMDDIAEAIRKAAEAA